MPLLLGGVAVGALGVRALWRRWDLVDRLAGERDAYMISDVLAYASREATKEAAMVRGADPQRRQSARAAVEARVQAAAGDLEALASELEDEELALDPACAVACARLVSDSGQSPLLNPALPPEELCSRVRQFVPVLRSAGRGPPPRCPRDLRFLANWGDQMRSAVNPQPVRPPPGCLRAVSCRNAGPRGGCDGHLSKCIATAFERDTRALKP